MKKKHKSPFIAVTIPFKEETELIGLISISNVISINQFDQTFRMKTKAFQKNRLLTTTLLHPRLQSKQGSMSSLTQGLETASRAWRELSTRLDQSCLSTASD